MEIHYRRSGGFAGITTAVHLDVENLPRQVAEEIGELVRAAGIFQQPETLGRPQEAADDIQHDLEISDRVRTHRIRRFDSQSSPELIRLFDFLHQQAARMRKS